MYVCLYYVAVIDLMYMYVHTYVIICMQIFYMYNVVLIYLCMYVCMWCLHVGTYIRAYIRVLYVRTYCICNTYVHMYIDVDVTTVSHN